jgi:hypothetical protein
LSDPPRVLCAGENSYQYSRAGGTPATTANRAIALKLGAIAILLACGDLSQSVCDREKTSSDSHSGNGSFGFILYRGRIAPAILARIAAHPQQGIGNPLHHVLRPLSMVLADEVIKEAYRLFDSVITSLLKFGRRPSRFRAIERRKETHQFVCKVSERFVPDIDVGRKFPDLTDLLYQVEC